MNLSVDFLNECFSYDKNSGKLRWKNRPERHFNSISGYKAFNTRHSGRLAGYDSRGYKRLTIDGMEYFSHRIIWNMIIGYIPNGLEIDHINQCRGDNMLSNLRVVDRQENTKNRPISKNNNTGVSGVALDKRDGKYSARININKKLTVLGYFDNIFDAAACRKSAEIKNGYHENHGKKPRAEEVDTRRDQGDKGLLS